MALRVGEILVENGHLTSEQLQQALEEQHKTKKMLGEILINMGFISEKDFLRCIAQQQGILFLELKDMMRIDDHVIKTVPAKFIWHYRMMPINIQGNVLTVALADPFDVWPVDDLETHLGLRVEKVLAVTADIAEAARKYYGVAADTVEKLMSQQTGSVAREVSGGIEKIEDLERMSEDASVIRLVNQVYQQAISDRATDIHIEMFREELNLRYRVDGILYEVSAPETIKHLYPAIVSRIKVMSGLDIIERRRPQDGRAKVRIGPKEYELRVSVMPTIYGENIVIRILPATMLFDIESLGMQKKDLVILEQLIARPHGIVFVTGPTGSGKTTTLYSCLNRLNTAQRKIVTIEDPVEYELKGITQTQVNPKIDLTFSVILRSMLRHDPDIMMVGEVRDHETADITIQTALTGHLVFSTLHTNDAASGITRLMDIGLEPYLIASSVEVFIAQRLIRLICNNCKEHYEITEEIARHFYRPERGSDEGSLKQTACRGKGCKKCNNTGYMGRTGIYEILLLDDQIKKLILQKASSTMIKEKAVEAGMRTLKQDGWEKILAGLTTPEEVLRVVQ